jgi:aquaporin Z
LGFVFNLSPTLGHAWWQACLVETLYTFMLCFVCLNVAASKVHSGNNQFYGIAIGFVVVAGAYGGGSVSMGCFNPAVAMAIDLTSWWMGIKYGPVYMFFELIGAMFAAVLFKSCRPEEAEDEEWINADGKPVSFPVYGMSAKLLSEFLGTYFLVLTVGLNVLGKSTAAPFSIAAALMSMVFALGSCSGAHFNPAVTVAVICRGAVSASDGLKYMCVQFGAGICAAATYAAIMNGETFQLNPHVYRWDQVCGAEFVFTFLLCFVCLSVTTVKEPLSEFFGFAIGMCITVGGFAVGSISRASLNPAVSLGISSSHIAGGGVFYPCLIYTAVELSAGVVAACVFRMTRPSEYPEKNDESTRLSAKGEDATAYLKDLEAPKEGTGAKSLEEVEAPKVDDAKEIATDARVPIGGNEKPEDVEARRQDNAETNVADVEATP